MDGLTIGQIVDFLAAPFVASLILTGIHSYLGVHVVERGVIFVDLSLAQIAALGATIAILLPFSGGDPHAPSVYWVSLVFTFIGAAIFSMIRGRKARIPQEAIIGISYAVASAAAILAMSKTTSESEHLKDMLVGNILAVSWPEVWQIAGLYGGDRPVPLPLPQAVPGDLDEPRRGGSRAATTCGCGIFSSTHRSAWSSRRRSRSPECYSSSAT